MLVGSTESFLVKKKNDRTGKNYYHGNPFKFQFKTTSYWYNSTFFFEVFFANPKTPGNPFLVLKSNPFKVLARPSTDKTGTKTKKTIGKKRKRSRNFEDEAPFETSPSKRIKRSTKSIKSKKKKTQKKKVKNQQEEEYGNGKEKLDEIKKRIQELMELQKRIKNQVKKTEAIKKLDSSLIMQKKTPKKQLIEEEDAYMNDTTSQIEEEPFESKIDVFNSPFAEEPYTDYYQNEELDVLEFEKFQDYQKLKKMQEEAEIKKFKPLKPIEGEEGDEDLWDISSESSETFSSEIAF